MIRILCLHGSGASGDILQTQLAPVIYELAKTTEIDFHFLNGPVEVPPASGLAEQYDGPFYRFFEKDAPQINRFMALLAKSTEDGISPEAFSLAIREEGKAGINSSTACDFLEKHLDQHRGLPFDGVLGFSEGASLATALMLRQNSTGKAWPFRFAIFICALPPFAWDEDDVMLTIETTQCIRVPTAHILGAEDPARPLSRVTYGLCEESSASLVYHKGGHTIPWDPQTTAVVGEAILGVIRRAPDSTTAP